MTTETSIYEYAKQGLSHGEDRIAIWFYGRSITYGELFEKIDNVADHLYELGVREGTVVTIHLPNCPQAVMAIYAVAKLGGICNMVHALTPKAAVIDNMRFAESRILLTYQPWSVDGVTVFIDVSAYMGMLYRIGYRLKNREKLPSETVKFAALESNCSSKGDYPIQTDLSDKCVAYFHSSGTTGEPKTVMHSHKTINNWVANAKDFFHKNTMVGESLLAVLPMFHASGFAMDMHQLITGKGTLVQIAQWNAKIAAKWIDQQKITYLTGVPKVYQGLLAEPRFKGTSLNQCFVSGDNVGDSLKLGFNRRVGKEHCLYEGYGMTEIVTACFSCGVDHDNILASGYPLNHCEIAVLTDDGSFERTGTGQLLVSTNTMMMGYLKDAYATNAALLTINGINWLKTGDYGRIDEDGYVYFIDRIKNTIIHNGYTIFPTEIEAMTRKNYGVEDVCIVGIKNKTGTQTVRAYVVPRGNLERTELEKQLRREWEEHLPRFTIPKEIVFMDSLPQNMMAKVDRKQLEQMP